MAKRLTVVMPTEIETAPAVAEAVKAATAETPTEEPKGKRLTRREHALIKLAHALERVQRLIPLFAATDVGNDLVGATGILTSARDNAAVLPADWKPGKGAASRTRNGFVLGDIVQIRANRRDQYEGALLADQLDHLTVTGTRGGKWVSCQTDSGEQVIIRAGHLAHVRA